MNGRNPTKDERRWLAAITDLGCIVCLLEHGQASPASPHHIDGSQKPGAHLRTIPLCWAHHQGGSDGSNEPYVSRHPFKNRFVEEYGTEQELLKDTAHLVDWEFDDEQGRPVDA